MVGVPLVLLCCTMNQTKLMPNRIFELRETIVNGNDPSASAKPCGSAPNMNGTLAVMTNKRIAVTSMVTDAIPKRRRAANMEATTKHALKISVSYSDVTKSLTI